VRLLLTILLFALTASADTWQYRVPMRDSGDRNYKITLRINGRSVSCLLDTGAGAPVNALWLQRQTASKLGLRREGSGYHYYQGLNVSVGSFSRSGVLSYEYDAAWNPDDQCLVGLSFFKGKGKFLIDTTNNSFSFR
jgi:hypothetical protein